MRNFNCHVRFVLLFITGILRPPVGWMRCRGTFPRDISARRVVGTFCLHNSRLSQKLKCFFFFFLCRLRGEAVTDVRRSEKREFITLEGMFIKLSTYVFFWCFFFLFTLWGKEEKICMGKKLITSSAENFCIRC